MEELCIIFPSTALLKSLPLPYCPLTSLQSVGYHNFGAYGFRLRFQRDRLFFMNRILPDFEHFKSLTPILFAGAQPIFVTIVLTNKRIFISDEFIFRCGEFHSSSVHPLLLIARKSSNIPTGSSGKNGPLFPLSAAFVS